MARDFRARAVPLDGIGFQTHINLKSDDPKTLASFASNLERFSHLGMEIRITELDIALDDNSPPSLQAPGELYRKVTEICLLNPSCRVLQTWGFSDKCSSIPGHSTGRQGWALPFDARYQKKPAYDGIVHAL
jgi:endo-1,4-beta-xylanase